MLHMIVCPPSAYFTRGVGRRNVQLQRVSDNVSRKRLKKTGAPLLTGDASTEEGLSKK